MGKNFDRWSARVVSKFHYTDPQTLFVTQPDPRTNPYKAVRLSLTSRKLVTDLLRGIFSLY